MTEELASEAVPARTQDTGRDLILRRAESGEISPDEAEAEAEAKSAGPLAIKLPFERHNPLEESYWTLAMALAWLVWGEPERVLQYSNDYRFRSRMWVKSGEGHRLQRPPYATVTNVIHDAADADPASEVFDLQKLLWRAFEQGESVVTGIRPHDADRERVPIPKEAWADLSPVFVDRGHEDGVCSHEGDLRYDKVYVAREDILRLRRECEYSSRPKQTVADQSACTQWLVELFKSSPGKPTKKNAELFEEAKTINKWPRLGSKQFDRAKAEANLIVGPATAWNRGGRPPKKT